MARQRREMNAVAVVVAWRRHVAGSALRRRGEDALARWLRSSRLRRWLHGWRQQVSRALRAHTVGTSRAHSSRLEALRRLCVAWREAVALEKTLGGHLQVRFCRLGSRLFNAWRRYVARAKRSCALAEFVSAALLHRALGALHNLHEARWRRTWRLLSWAARTW